MTEAVKITQLAERVDDVRFDDVKSTLKRLAERAEGGDAVWAEDNFVPDKCVVLLVDSRNGGYRVRINQSAGKLTERLAILEIAKLLSFKEMGYGG